MVTQSLRTPVGSIFAVVAALLVFLGSTMANAQTPPERPYEYWLILPPSVSPKLTWSARPDLLPTRADPAVLATNPDDFAIGVAGYGLIIQNPASSGAVIQLEYFEAWDGVIPDAALLARDPVTLQYPGGAVDPPATGPLGAGTAKPVYAYVAIGPTRSSATAPSVEYQTPSQRNPDPIGSTPTSRTEKLTPINGFTVGAFDSVDIKIPREEIRNSSGALVQRKLELAPAEYVADAIGVPRSGRKAWGLKLSSSRPVGVVLYNRAVRDIESTSGPLSGTFRPVSETTRVLPVSSLGTKYFCAGWGAGYTSPQNSPTCSNDQVYTLLDTKYNYHVSVVAMSDAVVDISVPCLRQVGRLPPCRCPDSPFPLTLNGWQYASPRLGSWGSCENYFDNCVQWCPCAPAPGECECLGDGNPPPGWNPNLRWPPAGLADGECCWSPIDRSLRQSVRTMRVRLRAGEVFDYADPLMFSVETDKTCFHNFDDRYRAIQIESVPCQTSGIAASPVAVFLSTTAIKSGAYPQLEQARPAGIVRQATGTASQVPSEFVFICPTTKGPTTQIVAHEDNTSVYVFAQSMTGRNDCDGGLSHINIPPEELDRLGLQNPGALYLAFGHPGSASGTRPALQAGDVVNLADFNWDGSPLEKGVLHIVALHITTDANGEVQGTPTPAPLTVYASSQRYVPGDGGMSGRGALIEVVPVCDFASRAWVSAPPAFDTHQAETGQPPAWPTPTLLDLVLCPPSPLGMCCDPNTNACSMVSREQCRQMPDRAWTLGATCAPNSCESTYLGACCVGQTVDSCVFLSAVECGQRHGYFRLGTTCAAEPCQANNGIPQGTFDCVGGNTERPGSPISPYVGCAPFHYALVFHRGGGSSGNGAPTQGLSVRHYLADIEPANTGIADAVVSTWPIPKIWAGNPSHDNYWVSLVRLARPIDYDMTDAERCAGFCGCKYSQRDPADYRAELGDYTFEFLPGLGVVFAAYPVSEGMFGATSIYHAAVPEDIDIATLTEVIPRENTELDEASVGPRMPESTYPGDLVRQMVWDDIVLPRAVGDSIHFEYTLNLRHPRPLEERRIAEFTRLTYGAGGRGGTEIGPQTVVFGRGPGDLQIRTDQTSYTPPEQGEATVRFRVLREPSRIVFGAAGDFSTTAAAPHQVTLNDCVVGDRQNPDVLSLPRVSDTGCTSDGSSDQFCFHAQNPPTARFLLDGQQAVSWRRVEVRRGHNLRHALDSPAESNIGVRVRVVNAEDLAQLALRLAASGGFQELDGAFASVRPENLGVGRYTSIEIQFYKINPSDQSPIVTVPAIDYVSAEFDDPSLAIDAYIQDVSSGGSADNPERGMLIGRYALSSSDFATLNNEDLKSFVRTFSTANLASGQYQARAVLRSVMTSRVHMVSPPYVFTVGSPGAGSGVTSRVSTDQVQYEPGQTVQFQSLVQALQTTPRLENLTVLLRVVGPDSRVVDATTYVIGSIQGPNGVDSTPWAMFVSNQLAPSVNYRVEQTVMLGGQTVAQSSSPFAIVTTNQHYPHLSGTISVNPPQLPEQTGDYEGFNISLSVRNDGNIDLSCVQLTVSLTDGVAPILPENTIANLWVGDLLRDQSSSFIIPYAGDRVPPGLPRAVLLSARAAQFANVSSNGPDGCVQSPNPVGPPIALNIAGFVRQEGSGGGGPGTVKAYLPIDLGTLKRSIAGVLVADESSEPYGMNRSGDVVGASWSSSQATKPVLWRCGSIREIPLPNGGASGVAGVSGIAHAINDDGVVVGEYVDASGRHHGFFWRSVPEDNRATQVPDVAPFTDAGLLGINNRVLRPAMVGSRQDLVQPTGPLVALQVVPQVGFGGFNYSSFDFSTIGSVTSSAVRAINDLGDVIGSATYSPSSDPGAFMVVDGVTRRVSVVSGASRLPVVLHDLSNWGIAVGRVGATSAEWRPIVARGSMTYTLRGPAGADVAGEALAINNRGLVVGYSRSGSTEVACQWRNGTHRAVQSLIPEGFLGPIASLQRAVRVNDSGAIAAIGMVGQKQHAILLLPLPLPKATYEAPRLTYFSRSDISPVVSATGFDWRDIGGTDRRLTLVDTSAPPIMELSTSGCCEHAQWKLFTRSAQQQAVMPRRVRMAGDDICQNRASFAGVITFGYFPNKADPRQVLFTTGDSACSGSTSSSPITVWLDQDGLILETQKNAPGVVARLVLGSAQPGVNVLAFSVRHREGMPSSLAWALNGGALREVSDLAMSLRVVDADGGPGATLDQAGLEPGHLEYLTRPLMRGVVLGGAPVHLLGLQMFDDLSNAELAAVVNAVSAEHQVLAEPHPTAISWFHTDSVGKDPPPTVATTAAGAETLVTEWANSAVRPGQLETTLAPRLVAGDRFGPHCRQVIKFLGAEHLLSSDLDRSLELAVLVDTSLSMDDEFLPGDSTKLKYAAAVARYVSELASESTLDAAPGTDYLRLMQLGPVQPKIFPTNDDFVVQSTPSSGFVQALEELLGLDRTQGTLYAPSLETLARQPQDPKPAFLTDKKGHVAVVISDGGANDSGRRTAAGADRSGYSRTRDLLAAARHRVVVNTIGVAESDAQPEDATETTGATSLLADLARATGGAYLPLTTQADLDFGSRVKSVGEHIATNVLRRARGTVETSSVTIIFAPLVGGIDSSVRVLWYTGNDQQGLSVVLQRVLNTGGVLEDRVFCSVWSGSEVKSISAPVSAGEAHCLQVVLGTQGIGASKRSVVSGYINGGVLADATGARQIEVAPLLLDVLTTCLGAKPAGFFSPKFVTNAPGALAGVKAEVAEIIVEPSALSNQLLVQQRMELARKYHIRFPENLPPVAVVASAGLLQVPDRGWDGYEDVVLDGRQSFDPDGSLSTAAFAWFEGARRLATGPLPTVRLQRGQHVIRLRVADSGGLIDHVEFRVNVVSPPESVVFKYKFSDKDEADIVADVSGNKLHALISGDPDQRTFGRGRDGRGLELRKCELELTSADALPFGNEPRTIAAWCDISSSDGEMQSVYAQTGTGPTETFEVTVGSAGVMLSVGQEALLFGLGSNLDLSWHHVAVVVPVGAVFAQQARVYIDGIRVSLIGGPVHLIELHTGRASGVVSAAQTEKPRRIDEVQVLAAELSDAEVESLVRGAPVHQWPCGEGSGQNCADWGSTPPAGNTLAHAAGTWSTDTQRGPVPTFEGPGSNLETTWVLSEKIVTAKEWSCALWVRLASAPPPGSLVPLVWQPQDSDPPIVWLEADAQRVRTRLSEEPVAVEADLSVGVWHAIVLTWSEKGARVWVDGKVILESDKKMAAPAARKLRCGGAVSGGAGFVGSLSDIRLYAKMLDEDDVLEFIGTAE